MRPKDRAVASWTVGVALLVGLGMTHGYAQTAGSPLLPPGWHARHVRVVAHRTPVHHDVVAERRLTVRKRIAPEGDEDVFTESGTVYGDVAAYVPAPLIDSGVQFPYGLDGVGGYGSDLGFAAGNDGEVYDRGALDNLRQVTLRDR